MLCSDNYYTLNCTCAFSIRTMYYRSRRSREIDTKMVITGIFFAAACLSMVNCFDFQLPCDSYLRPSLPEFFTHCCTYSDFSEWKLTSFMSVPTNQCASGSVVVEKRVKTVISGDCDNITEERISECKK